MYYSLLPLEGRKALFLNSYGTNHHKPCHLYPVFDVLVVRKTRASKIRTKVIKGCLVIRDFYSCCERKGRIKGMSLFLWICESKKIFFFEFGNHKLAELCVLRMLPSQRD